MISMKPMLTLQTHEQLKAMSDPLRSKMMMLLIERPFTGQQLAAELNLSRAKVHYHLKELAKNNLITIVRTEEKNGIVQKFYQSVASGFVPDPTLLPHKEEMGEVTRSFALESVERTRKNIISAPEEAFQEHVSEDPTEWPFMIPTIEVTATKEDYQKFNRGFHQLVNELRQNAKQAEQNPSAKLYRIDLFAFQIEESNFVREQDEDDEN